MDIIDFIDVMNAACDNFSYEIIPSKKQNGLQEYIVQGIYRIKLYEKIPRRGRPRELSAEEQKYIQDKLSNIFNREDL